MSLISLLTSVLAVVSAADAPDSTSVRQLDEVVVDGQSARMRIRGTKLGAERLEMKKLALTPVLFGERDIVKAITLLPGVSSEGEGSGGFEVRGGTSAQNLVTLDGITLYNPSHVMGTFSIFNDDAIGSATLYKGPIPQSFGQATSSVLDVGLASGPMDRWRASGTVGLLAAKAKAAGPVIRDRLSMSVTARRSYADLFLKIVPKYRDIVMHFYDVTGKVTYTPTLSDRVDLSVYAARDNMAIDDLMSMKWGNVGVSARWNATRGDRWRFVTTGAFTSYTAEMGMSMMQTNQIMDTYIRNGSLDSRINLRINGEHQIEWGMRSELLSVLSADWVAQGNHERQLKSGLQNSLWAGYSGTPAGWLSIDGGVRMSIFSVLGGRHLHEFISLSDTGHATADHRQYLAAEPRLNIRFAAGPLHSIKAGAGISSQAIHSLRASSSSFPFDRYAIASAGIRPLKVTQYSLAYTGMTDNGGFEWSAEAYFKQMENVYDYADGRSMLSDIDVESVITGGRGRSVGAEFMIRKNSGRLTGWISYTFSKTQSRINGINGGKWYDASNDRPHHAAAVAIFSLTPKWNLSATWTYASGTPLTATDAKYELDGATCYYYSARNSYRTPPTHHLDVAATYTSRGPGLTYEWSIGIYNLYNRYNPYIIYFVDNDERPSGTSAMQRSLYGIVPSVSYTLRF
ncbi:MAG: TonB-dependent receptor plug domain-containing protein [Muribaculaceae bacterium]|nr:TonB-dependent receptor plug domain-containing protein [Muribaculaceae bacterium]